MVTYPASHQSHLHVIQMGRQQHLTRLALGRSAFQDSSEESEANASPFIASEDLHTQSPDDHGASDYIQEYDSKDRPINPVTEARNAELRRAQNSILALVGVVEDRDLQQQHDWTKHREIREARQNVLEAENARGDDLGMILELVSVPLEWWVHCLFRRCVVGLHHFRTPFVDIVGSVYTDMHIEGPKGLYSVFLPGSVAYLAHQFLRVGVVMVLDHALIGPLGYSIIKAASRKPRKNLFFALGVLRNVLLFGIDLALIPLSYYAIAQQLGIAPAFPLLPAATLLLPWRRDSLHNIGWRPLLSTSVFSAFTSPAALLVMKSFLFNEIDDEDDTPVNSILTSFRTPALNVPFIDVKSPSLLHDPLGWLLDKAYRARAIVLYWSGWVLWCPSTLRDTGAAVKYEGNCSLLEHSTSTDMKTYRSTSLAHLPAAFLATTIDGFFLTVLRLPLETLTWRAIATSYIQSTLPKASSIIQVTRQLYLAFSFVWPCDLSNPGSIAELGHYTSKIGLCFALKACVDALLIGGICRIVRRQGIQNFNWGSHSAIGDIDHATPTSSPFRRP